MKSRVRTILLSVFATIGLILIVAMGVWSAQQTSCDVCRNLYITIADSTQRQFFTEENIRTYLDRKGLSLQDKPINEISCAAVEECLLQHDLIRTAQCYKSPRNDVYIEVTQRVPILYVVANDGCYYVDSDCKIMPLRASVKVNVLTLEGSVSRRAAQEEFFDFTMWLMHEDYWSTRISRVQVDSPRRIVLWQRENSARILLGSLDNYQQKMDKLKKLYTHGFDIIGYPPYREYDLRFAGQVVGRK